MPVYFYLPSKELPLEGPWPLRADDFWYGFQHGLYAWILQTYLHLSSRGFDCKLVEDLPPDGIVIFYGATIPRSVKPAPDQLLIHIKSDTIEHPYAQLHIVQNPLDPLCRRDQSYWSPYYIPFWLQSGLIPRNEARGEKLENAVFFGHTKRELAAVLLTEEWRQKVSELSMNWIIQPADLWNDYSETDVVVAVRSFGSKPYFHKPFTKLVNAWRAGVPAILSPDSAYRLLRKSELDYIEVTSRNELLNQLKRLKEDKHLRDAMVSNGLVRAQELNAACIAGEWIKFLEEIAPEALQQWMRSKSSRTQFLRVRRLNAVRLELERSLLESYAPWLRNRPFDLDELKFETKAMWTQNSRKLFQRLIKRR